MADKIRRIEERDLLEVSALYNGRKSVEELKWLFTNPDDSTIYNAFVAEDNKNQIIGVIGYVVSVYSQNSFELSGSIPISWKLHSEYKGIAGVLLFKKVMGLGDFGITIAGSETAKDLYKLFKYKYLSNIDQYYKILELKDSYKSLHRKSFIKTLGMFACLLPSYFNTLKRKQSEDNIGLIKYNGSNFAEDIENTSVFKKKINKNYLDWLLDCPLVKSDAFVIKRGDKNLGVCILYIKEEGNIKKGRIVHLPYLGNDVKIWESVIDRCIYYLKENGCCIVNASAHNTINKKGYLSSGFVNIKKHYKPLYIKDPKKSLDHIDLNNWHLQYSEGDKAYRSF